MSNVYENFRIVDDELRKAALQGKWTNVIAALTVGRTIAIPANDAKAAANALSQAMRARGQRLRRKTMDIEGTKATVFWSEKKLA